MREIEFPKTHNLALLIDLVAEIQPSLNHALDASDKLTRYAIETRYPDDFREIGKTEMDDTIETAKMFQGIILPVIEGWEKDMK